MMRLKGTGLWCVPDHLKWFTREKEGRSWEGQTWRNCGHHEGEGRVRGEES